MPTNRKKIQTCPAVFTNTVLVKVICRREVESIENYFICLKFLYNNFHKAAQGLLFRDERKWKDVIYKMSHNIASNKKTSGRCLLLLMRTFSAHHASISLSARALGLTLTQSTTPSSTRLKLKQNFPTVTKSSLMSLDLNQEHQKSSI